MKKRIITAIVGVPLLFALLYLGGWFLFAACLVLSMVGVWEYARAFNRGLAHPVNILLMEILTVIITVLMKLDFYSMLPILMVLMIVLLCYEVINGKHDIYRGIVSCFGLMYIPVLFGFLMLFDMAKHGDYFLWMIFVIAFVTDTAAYFTGRAIGKHKMAPEISPKKTWEGAVGGLVFAAIAMLIYGVVLRFGFQFDLPLWTYPIAGLIGSIAGQCGDLTASLIKRRMGIKDFGWILPGHGGILDRFDSILFVIPIVYVFASMTPAMV